MNAVSETKEDGCKPVCRGDKPLARPSYGVCSDPGLRPVNEDYVAVAEGRFFVVCDGMGGADLGGAMSRAAGLAAMRAMSLGKGVVEAVVEADEAVRDCQALTGAPDSGTTIVAALLDGEFLGYSWVGDSMLYRLREGRLDSLTKPHRLRGHLLSRALGMAGPAALQSGRCRVRAGDRYVLCSDGVWDALGDEGMLAALLGRGPSPLVARRLVEEAVRRGDDNASAIVIVPL